MTKLFVGGIAYSVTKEALEELFAKYGTVTSVAIITDKFTGQSKGFGFVEMADDAEANEAIKALDGYGLDGRKIGVSVARPKEEFPRRSGGFGGNSGNGGGGYSNGGGGYNNNRSGGGSNFSKNKRRDSRY